MTLFSSAVDEQFPEYFYRRGQTLLTALCHRELHPDRLEVSLARQMVRLARAHPISTPSIPAPDGDGGVALSQQLIELLPMRPVLMPTDEFGMRSDVCHAPADAPPWLPLSEPISRYTGSSPDIRSFSQTKEPEVQFCSSGAEFPGRDILPEQYALIYISPRLPGSFNLLSRAYEILMKEVFAMLWQHWKYLLALSAEDDYNSELYACYDVVYTSFIKGESILLDYPKLRFRKPAKIQQKIARKYHELYASSGTADAAGLLSHEAFRRGLLRPWVAYQIRQHSLGLLCAFYETQQAASSGEPLFEPPFRLYAYEELFLNALNQAAPRDRQELLVYSKLRGDSDDCCIRDDCDHTWRSIKQSRALYKEATDLDISQKELRERLNGLHLPYLEKNRENRSVKTCYMHLIIEQDIRKYKK